VHVALVVDEVVASQHSVEDLCGLYGTRHATLHAPDGRLVETAHTAWRIVTPARDVKNGRENGVRTA
jgi:hypothetical protein